MNLHTVSEVIKKYGISSRMLSYYEQNGLIKSQRASGYSYRVYDETALRSLQQIIILRKLQIPVKQIRVILNNPGAEKIIGIFQTKIQNIDGEITALSTINNILAKFVDELETLTNLNLQLDFLNGDGVLELTGSLSLIQKNVKEKIDMTELNQSNESLNELQEENWRDKFMSRLPEASISVIFDGNCKEAMAFYAEVFKVNDYEVMTMGDLQRQYDNPCHESERDRVGIGNMQIYDLDIRFFDCSPDGTTFSGLQFNPGNNVVLHLEIAGTEETTRVFNGLKEGGDILQDLEPQFFAALHGGVKDRFGIIWNILGH